MFGTPADKFHFSVNPAIRYDGIKSLFYDKEEHWLSISHSAGEMIHVLDLLTGKLRCEEIGDEPIKAVLSWNSKIITAHCKGKVEFIPLDSESPGLREIIFMGPRAANLSVSSDCKYLIMNVYQFEKGPKVQRNSINICSTEESTDSWYMAIPCDHKASGRGGISMLHDNRLYVAGDCGCFYIFDFLKCTQLFADFYDNQELQCLCLFPSLNRIVFSGIKGHIFVCDNAGQRMTQTKKGSAITHMMVHSGQPNLLVSLNSGGTVDIWQMPDLELIATIKVDHSCLLTAAMVGDLLLTGGKDGIIRIYDLSDVKTPKQVGKLMVTAESFAFFPAGAKAFYCDNQSIIQMERDDGAVCDDLLADYLISSHNDFNVFRTFFLPGNQDFHSPDDFTGMYQLTK